MMDATIESQQEFKSLFGCAVLHVIRGSEVMSRRNDRIRGRANAPRAWPVRINPRMGANDTERLTAVLGTGHRN